MKELIRHLVHTNMDEILSRSLLHCHCKGLHSIMLLESPGKTIRLYVHEPTGDMRLNFPHEVDSGGSSMSISFHPHHCDLTLHCVKGKFMNWEVKPSTWGRIYKKYKYHSKINEGELQFEPLGDQCLINVSRNFYHPGQSVFLPAGSIHTVACFPGELSAWLVYEGKEDPDYQSLCWSNADLNQQDFSGLYVKPTHDEIISLLKQTELL